MKAYKKKVKLFNPLSLRERWQQGFTLIEILVALTVFAILTTITSTFLYNAFTTRARVNEQADQLNTLQLALSIMQQDTLQCINRAVRGNDMHLFPPFVGLGEYLEFTRSGMINPQSMEQRSTLKRIAFVCTKSSLIRRSWWQLDTPNRDAYDEDILIPQVKECHFNYINKNLQVLSEWRGQIPEHNLATEPLPKALQINLILEQGGKLNLLFIIPEGLYAPTQ